VKKDIDRGILQYLAEQDWPVTTEMVANGIKVSWNTAQIHLLKLLAEGKVKGKKVGRQNQWIVSKWGMTGEKMKKRIEE